MHYIYCSMHFCFFFQIRNHSFNLLIPFFLFSRITLVSLLFLTPDKKSKGMLLLFFGFIINIQHLLSVIDLITFGLTSWKYMLLWALGLYQSVLSPHILIPYFITTLQFCLFNTLKKRTDNTDNTEGRFITSKYLYAITYIYLYGVCYICLNLSEVLQYKEYILFY